MELKVDEYQLPDIIKFNFDELKLEITEKVQKYKTLVYTDEQIKEAKADRASLNKLKSAINEERLRREREYMQPFIEFKAKVTDIISIIDEPIRLIDEQIKEYDAKVKQEKLDKVTAYFNEAGLPDWMRLDMIIEDSWMNKTTSMKSITDRIDGWKNRIETELNTIAELPEFSFEAAEEYKRTLDLGKAIAEGKRLADIQKRKQEAAEAKIKAQEQMKAEAEARAKAQAEAEMHKADEKLTNSPMEQYMTPPTPAEPAAESKMWVKFAAYLTVSQALELKQFFIDHGIEYKAMEG